MEQIHWDSSYSVAVEAIDHQHRSLVEMINVMIGEPNVSVESEVISETLMRMTSYAEEHFKTEEQFMEQYGYPDLPSHRQSHRDFRRTTAKLCMEAMVKHAEVPEEILDYLKSWLVQHILTIDMKYKSFFAERGVK